MNRALAPIILISCWAFGWYLLGGRSLALDECASFWIIKDGWRPILERSSQHLPFFHYILWGVSEILGHGEIALRVPSLISILLAALMLYLSVKELVDRETAAYAALIFLFLEQGMRCAITSRPYALALFCAFGSLHYLIRFSRRPRFRSIVLYALFTAALAYTQILFLAVVSLHLIVFIFLTQRQHQAFGHLALGLALAAALILPVYFLTGELVTRRNSLVFSKLPEWRDLFAACFPPSLCLILGLVGCVAVGLKIWRQKFSLEGRCRTTLLALTWQTLPAILFFCVSHLATTAIFVDRYRYWNSGGSAVLIAILISGFHSARLRGVIACLVCLVSSGLFIHSLETKDWREASQALQQLDGKRECSVFLLSGLIEANSVNWNSATIQKLNYLLAPTAYYDFGPKVFPLPFNFHGPQDRQYFSETLKPIVDRARCIVIVMPNRFSGVSVHSQLITEFKAKGQASLVQLTFDPIDVLLLSRTERHL